MFEYEQDRNEGYRSINLVQPAYISGVLDEARGLFRYWQDYPKQKPNLLIVQLRVLRLLEILRLIDLESLHLKGSEVLILNLVKEKVQYGQN